MSVIITLHIYSGVPDPAWELSDAQAKELSDRIREIENTTLQKPSGLHGGLGYRGFSITSVGEKLLDAHVYVHGGIVDLDRFDLNRATNSTELEIWLLSTGADSVPDDVREYVEAQLNTELNLMSPQGLILAVPPYNPGKWNNDSNIRTRNNCYNYANDKLQIHLLSQGSEADSSIPHLTAEMSGLPHNVTGRCPRAHHPRHPRKGIS